MKNLYFILGLAIILGSCTNVKKLIEQGRYDDALDYSIKKLAGKDKKKTEHVMALEDAYARLVEKDQSTIKYLESQGRPEMYTKIHNLYETLHNRQNRIKPFLPLISEDGYAAHFVMKDYGGEIRNSSEIAAKFHYDQAIALIQKAKKGDKLSARAAYRELTNVEQFYQIYEDKDSLMDLANFLGMTRILVESYNDSGLGLSKSFNDELVYLELTGLYSRWVEFYDYQPDNIPMDIQAMLLYKEIDVSPERIEVHHHTDTKEIITGTQLVQKTITVKDTSDNLINQIIEEQEDIYTTITAVTTETFKDKAAHITARAIFIDLVTGNEILNKALEGNTVFHDETSIFTGDKDALCDSASHGWSAIPAPFPSDEVMLLDASVVIKSEFHQLLESRFK